MTGLIHETYETVRTDEEKKIDADVLARVKRGMRLLEERYGADWVEHIDLEVLDLSNGARCVLGQMYGHRTGKRPTLASYEKEASHLGLAYETPKYGFDAEDEDAWPDEMDEEYEALTAAWRHAIEMIRGGG